MKQGIYQGISLRDYHADKESYSSSTIKMMSVPALAKHYMDTPQEHKECYRIGGAIHKFILEPDDFHKEFLLGIDTPRRSKENKNEWAQWFTDNGADGLSVIDGPASTWNGKFEQQTGKHMVKPEEIEEIKEMAAAISNDPDAKTLISDGDAESSLYWLDEDTGLNLRIRPDYMNNRFISDIKSIDSVDDNSINRAMKNLGYGISASMYQDGVYQVTGVFRPFVFIFIQKKAPRMIRLICLSDEAQQVYYYKYVALKQMLADCMKSGEWPGYEHNLKYSPAPWVLS